MRMRLNRKKTEWLIIAAIALTLGIVISLLVLGSPERDFTATAYSDVIRFEAEGVATLQVRIFDLSGKVVWDSSVVSGDTIDWDRRNDTGERLAYGAYIYSAQGWNAQGDLIFQKNGKLALMPGDKVQLQAAPAVVSSHNEQEDVPVSWGSHIPATLRPLGVDPANNHLGDGAWAFDQIGIGTADPTHQLHVDGGGSTGTLRVSGASGSFALQSIAGSVNQTRMVLDNTLPGGRRYDIGSKNDGTLCIIDSSGGGNRLVIDSSGNVGIGTTSPTHQLHVDGGGSTGTLRVSGAAGSFALQSIAGGVNQTRMVLDNTLPGGRRYDIGSKNDGTLCIIDSSGGENRLVIDSSGNVGIGTTSPTAKLEIESSTGQDLIAAYPSSSRVAGAAVFVVKSTGEVRADGAYYSGAGDCNTGGFNAGGADVAERINVSEWVEAGNVVEIDPEHPGFFRKASSPYSTKVAGIISTSPGVILGNSFDEATDDWEDNRTVLAVTGRVPCKVSVENGPIEIGDLLVASSTPGVAMKGNSEESMGAVVGKAMEPLEIGTGIIVVQVMLR